MFFAGNSLLHALFAIPPNFCVVYYCLHCFLCCVLLPPLFSVLCTTASAVACSSRFCSVSDLAVSIGQHTGRRVLKPVGSADLLFTLLAVQIWCSHCWQCRFAVHTVGSADLLFTLLAAQNVAPFVETPIFVLQSAVDSWQLHNHRLSEPDEVNAYADRLRGAMNTSLFLPSKTNGGFVMD